MGTWFLTLHNLFIPFHFLHNMTAVVGEPLNVEKAGQRS